MAEYRRTVDEFGRCFAGLEVRHISRDDNDTADALARIGSKQEEVPPNVFLHHLHKPSIKGGDEDYPSSAESVNVCLVTPDWTTPYINFLRKKELPKDDEVLSRQMERRAKAYTIIDGQLYKRSTSGIFQRCVSPEEGRQILQEIHSGECGHHVAAKALVAKAFRHGFFWLAAKKDAINIVKTCEGSTRRPEPPSRWLRSATGSSSGSDASLSLP